MTSMVGKKGKSMHLQPILHLLQGNEDGNGNMNW